MSQRRTAPERGKKDEAPLPIGQEEGEGTNAVRHEPDPKADPVPDGDPKYMSRKGHIHGND